jgi:hypothetical protein
MTLGILGVVSKGDVLEKNLGNSSEMGVKWLKDGFVEVV